MTRTALPILAWKRFSKQSAACSCIFRINKWNQSRCRFWGCFIFPQCEQGSEGGSVAKTIHSESPFNLFYTIVAVRKNLSAARTRQPCIYIYLICGLKEIFMNKHIESVPWAIYIEPPITDESLLIEYCTVGTNEAVSR